MPDSEMFKVIVQGGSFAMIVLGFVWLLFKAEPGYRKTAEETAKSHKEAVENINHTHQITVENTNKNHHHVVEALTTTFKESLGNQLKSFETVLANMQKDFKESLETHEKQCRAERKEWMEVMRTEGDMNRNSRHDMVEKLTKLYTETFFQFRNKDEEKT